MVTLIRRTLRLIVIIKQNSILVKVNLRYLYKKVIKLIEKNFYTLHYITFCEYSSRFLLLYSINFSKKTQFFHTTITLKYTSFYFFISKEFTIFSLITNILFDILIIPRKNLKRKDDFLWLYT